MKKITTLLMFIIALYGKVLAQTASVDSLPEKNGKVVYEAVYAFPGVSKDKMYAAAKKWIVDNFKSAKAVIQSEDKDGGQIIGQGYFEYSEIVFINAFKYKYSFTLQLDIKDNKCRIRLYDITCEDITPKSSISTFNSKAAEPSPIEGYNKSLKESKNKKAHQKAAVLDEKFKDVLKRFYDAISKSKSDDF